jgi:hypothetical protein
MKGSYVIWQYESVDGACALGELRGLEKTFRLNNGTPLAAQWPAEVAFHMHPDYPNDILLVDNVLNGDMVIVASKRLQECVRGHAPPDVEYLPVSIVDHKGRVASADYAIIHPVNPVDCVDKGNSVFDVSLINPKKIDTFKKLVLDETKIPPARSFFRLLGFWRITLVRQDLAKAIDAMGLSGLSWLDIEDYPPV